MSDFIYASKIIDKSHIGRLVDIKEINPSLKKTSVYENCIIVNVYIGIMLKCCLILNDKKVKIYDLDSNIVKLYIRFVE